ncbi:MAG: HD domain-containing protein [Gammaproteobacteria bacterium]|nr:HD domain-containing protein [Gammaproteobacteria bacterium]
MNLGSAIALAASAFEGRTDKGGKPYILHCLHVMNKMKYEDDEELMIAAVLHDLVEDTHYTLADLKDMGYSTYVVSVINTLTHKEGQDYFEYIVNIGHSISASKIKIQDLRHNADILRMKGLRDKDFDRLKKYHKAYDYLKRCIAEYKNA